ncbi:hypothetical protein GCM10009556_031480 [Acrocarpospora pleiomorpha]|uniref:hypothetical protein n=1 Tax=Acrocarpospora pleiomorpha TaxID=90975 RepID=UPI0012D2A2C0|nr:hypothetical protein [Acrocarpospora pleiomorpha]
MRPVLIRPADPRSLDEVGEGLRAAFVTVRDAVAVGSPVVILVRAGDLLGHHSVYGAAYANGLAGIARAAGFEGARAGWKVNVVALPDGDAGNEEAIITAVRDLGLTGQVLTLGAGLAGKVIP